MSSSRGLFSNCAELVGVLNRLELVMVKIEDWIILQRSVFDITMDGEPFPALQLYFNIKTGSHLTRVWGRTHSKGEIVKNDVTEFELLCNQIFAQGLACCPGQTAEDGADECLISVEYPFQRNVSAGCAIFHLPNDAVCDQAPVALCVECKLDKNARIKIEEDDFCKSLCPDINIKEYPKDDVNDIDKDETKVDVKEYSMDDINDVGEEESKKEKEHVPEVKEYPMKDDIYINNIKKDGSKGDHTSEVEEYSKEDDINDTDEEESDEEYVPSFSLRRSRRKKAASKSKVKNITKVNSAQCTPGEEKDEKEKTTKPRSQPTPCGQCGKMLSTWYAAKHHEQMVHQTDKNKVPKTYRQLRGSRRCPALWRRQAKGKIECDHCGSQLATGGSWGWKGIARHYRRQHLWGNFFCRLCKFFAYYPIEYASHMLDRHSDMEGGVSAQCAECGEEIHLNGNVDTLAEHYKECAVAAENLKNKLLRERKKKEDDMKDASSSLISDVNKLCQICGKEYKQKHHSQHMWGHKMAKSPECPHPNCNALFATNKEKHNHMNAVHKKRPGVACEKCGKFFGCQAHLKEHMRVAHEKRSLDIKCTDCDLVFAQRYHMISHRTLVHYPDKFQCKTCQRCFINAHMLKRHDLVHSGERNFSCDECDRRFKTKEDLTDHKRIHSGEKPFACQYCPYRSTTSSLLYHHKRQRHRAEFDDEKVQKERAKLMVSDD